MDVAFKPVPLFTVALSNQDLIAYLSAVNLIAASHFLQTSNLPIRTLGRFSAKPGT